MSMRRFFTSALFSAKRGFRPFRAVIFRGGISRGVAPGSRIFAPLGLPGTVRPGPGRRASGSRARSIVLLGTGRHLLNIA